MEKLYYQDYGNGTGVDGTKYVLSGDYYFNCEHGKLIKKTAPKFPYSELASELTMQLGTSSRFESLNPVLLTYLANPSWNDGLQYVYTWLSTTDLIIADEFRKKTSINGNEVIINVLYNGLLDRGKKFTVGIFLYHSPSIAITHEQAIEQARNSCSKPQD